MTDLAAARARLVVALDTSDRRAILTLAGTLANRVGVLKVGLEAFTAHGPALVGEIRALGVPVFLDLKLHDIPNTVERAAANCARLGVAMLTVHASGGAAMLEAAMRGVAAGTPPGATPPKVLAVTVLTSLDDDALDELGIAGPAGARVRGWAALARRAGCDGVICSPHEAAALRGELGAGFLLVTPGIRPAGGAAADQKRIATPAAAIAAGADYLVIGRPITGAADPADAADAIAGELATVLPPPSGTRGTVDREPPESA